MLPGFSGTLLSEAFLEAHLAAGCAQPDPVLERVRRDLLAWRHRLETLGPASSLRAMLETGAQPLVTALEFDVASSIGPLDGALTATLNGGAKPTSLVVVAWGERLDPRWRLSVTEAMRRHAPYALLFNGARLRVADARRLFARRYVEFDVDLAIDDPRTLGALWAVARASVLAGVGAASLDALIAASDQHASSVCRSLRGGVLTATTDVLGALLARGSRARSRSPRDAFEQALTIVYRILFLLFAEARALVPVWHPIYRESYSLDALARAAEHRAGETGLWDALRATACLAHSGCSAGDLRVTPFNGRLFAPQTTPLADRRDLDDRAAGRAVLALMTRPGSGRIGRERISYRDLGVEQLGAVYETLLDYEPEVGPAREPNASDPRAAATLVRGSGARKATGSFYTPQPIADYLVRRTLAPLVHDRTPDAVLRLRIVDPAMGSGAILVAACRYLASAYEAALVRSGVCHAADIDEPARAAIRRTIAERCLYGVDLNPMAVQLARLSLWLTTLAADRPLSFLDHRLRVGDSLVGAWLAHLGRTPGTRQPRRASSSTPSLFDAGLVRDAFAGVLPARFTLESTPNDSVEDVRHKERLLLAIDRNPAFSKWKRTADLWCAGWFPSAMGEVPFATFGALSDAILTGQSSLPSQTAARYLERADQTARARHFLHWELEFPEVFFDSDGARRIDAGFDAVIGNPPWDVVRADAGTTEERDNERSHARAFVRFARDAGVYRAQSDGHPNRYQLFLERAMGLTRTGGRMGLVLPAGLATDYGCGPLRKQLLHECAVDALVGIDNRRGIFPIHRSVGFLLLTASAGTPTTAVACRFGVDDPATIESMGDDGAASAQRGGVGLSLALLQRISGPSLTIPLFRTALDLQIAERAASLFPPLASNDGWNVHFSRELNATEDRSSFRPAGRGLPVVGGKHIEPFRVDLGSVEHSVPEREARRLLPDRRYERPRLGYRDVASATNKLTLIAAVLPPHSVSTHTVFCLRTPLSLTAQHFLCGLFNSLVVNYLVRFRVTTHVTTATVGHLPIPVLDRDAPGCRSIAALARLLARGSQHSAYARLQARVAALYQLSSVEFEHVLSTFPLIPEEERRVALEIFTMEARGRQT